MKKFHKVLISSVLILITTPIAAQVNLQQWVKKCEKIESVDITEIKKRNPDTGKMEKDLTTISFKDNKSLCDELISACKKDEEKAYEVINNKKNGRSIPQIYRFRVGNTDHQYLFSYSDNGLVTVTIIVREKNSSEFKL